MKSKRTIRNRIYSLLLVLAMMLAMLPGSALALTTGTGKEVRLRAEHFCVDASGNYTLKLDDDEDLFNDIRRDLNDYLITNFEKNEINTYVYSPNMSEDEQDGSVVPYFYDQSERKWELYKVSVANGRQVATPGDQAVLMDPSDIKSATQINDYVVDTSGINFAPGERNYYFVWYGWKLAEGEQEEAVSYQVSYDLKLPDGVTTLYPATDYGISGIRMAIADGDGNKTQVEGELKQLAGEFYAAQPYTISDFSDFNSGYGYADFLTFNIYQHNNYYDFIGWKANNTGELYEIGEVIEDISALADADGKIIFTAKWEPIKLLTDTELAAAAQTLTLDGFVRSDEIDDHVLIVQSVGETTEKTGENVSLADDDIIKYLVSAHVNSSLVMVSDSGGMKFTSDFAEFTYEVRIDSKLEFANLDEDGNATIIFDASPENTYNTPNAPVILKSVNMTYADVQPTAEGIYSITFDPDDVPTDEDGSMLIQLNMQWNNETVSKTDASANFSIRELDFRIKPDVNWTANDTVESSANIVGSFSMRDKVSQPRAYYTTASSLLNDSWNGWGDYFYPESAPDRYPTAFVHAVQFMDYELANIDLSTDPMASLEANTVIATYPGTVTVTPADITIYMGGDGGYDAVVGEDGATTSNSLPHPLFEIDAPEGVDPAELTFTNGTSTWTVTCDNPNSEGTKYYHFVPGEDTEEVRVTYTYTAKDDTEHTVTSDTFDPAQIGDVFTELTVKLYPGTDDMSKIRAVSDGGTLYVATESGTLTVRAVEDSDPTSDIQDEAPDKAVAAGSAVAVEPESGTTYTLNDKGVPLPKDSEPSLLFDSIIEDSANSTARTDALADKADEKLGAVTGNATRHYEIKYLDLVDANNGNAWITSSAGTDIYWGYPEGTDRKTTFKLLHFKGLHRDDNGGNSGFEITDISGLDLDSVEIIDVENTEIGIKFHVDAGGFSPFALVWEKETGGGVVTTTYTLHYNTNGGDYIPPESMSYMWIKEFEELPTPSRDGYTFAGWHHDSDLTTPVQNDIKVHQSKVVIHAAWTANTANPDDTGVSEWLNTKEHFAYLSGYGGGIFGPERNMTRAEAAQMFYNLLLDKDVDITVAFDDVPDSAWHSDAVNTLASLGMIKGVGDNKFEPDRSITRSEFTAIAMRFTKGTADGENSFSDVSADDWFYAQVVGSAKYGWISGYPDGTFRPNNTITRAEVTTIVNRMLGRVADESYIDAHMSGLTIFTDVPNEYWGSYDIIEATNAHNFEKVDGAENWVGLK